ncbi:hypothetical protein BG015_009074 [Linnemannia schmuckeri]|uniref:Uncharacterized protein n=1 Tax=Linnemannia schmuckeri TaxID=64567 RepID=A0A9P5VA25_9FUNG|nr:hypothetical protein BG015_009074 [Linnemannia schmuckeri]
MIEWIVQKIIDASLEPQVLVVGIEGSGRRTFENQLNTLGGDKVKIEQTKITLERLFRRYERLLRKSALLVLTNKQDRLDALSVTVVLTELKLESQFKRMGLETRAEGSCVVYPKILQKIINALFEHQVLVINFDASGKFTFTLQLKNLCNGGVKTKSILIQHSSHAYLTQEVYQDTSFHIAVYGGNPRTVWDRYPEGTAGVICFVKSTDHTKIEQTRIALGELYRRHEELLGKSVLLVFTDKQDLPFALLVAVAEVRDMPELETRFRRPQWLIQGANAVSGDGLNEGVDWMAEYI